MTGITDFLNSLSNYMNQIIIGMIVFAVIMMIVMILLTSKSVRDAINKKVPPAPKAEPKKEEPTEDVTPPWGGLLSRYLTLKGYFRVGDLSLLFLRALDLLRDRLDTVNYKYYLPWYLMIGTSGSGKTSLMERSEFILPLGKPDFDVKEDNPGIRWWFLNRGIVLDVRGDMLIKDRGTQADEKGWQTISSLLSRYRARRPLDGVILTIPATELYGAHKLAPDELLDRAKYMAQKLITTQNFLGLRIPVYVVITKSDVIPGFQSVCHTIPVSNRHNILGWSCPYHPGEAYTGGWVAEAFGHVMNHLRKLKLEILSQGPSEETRDGVFVFPSELMHLQKPLSVYLNQIFKVTSYDEALLLRGIYFTGDSGQSLLHSQLTATPSSEVLAGDFPESTVHTKIGDLERTPHKPGDEHPTPIFFFNDLLNQKVFRETGLAQPIHQRLISANRNLNYAKAGMIGFVALSTFGIMKAYDNFRESRDYIMPVLGKINTILTQIPVSRLDQNHISAQMFDEQTRELLDMMNNLHKASFFSLFMPSSWFSPIDKSLQTSLKVSYDQIILRTVYIDLLLKARDMLTFKTGVKDFTESLADNLHPTKTVEYQLFKGYVQRFIDLSHHIDKYNRLQESSDPDLLKDLVSYTLGIELPKEFLQNYTHFRGILKEIPYPKIDLKPYQPTARETLKTLHQHFIDNMFAANAPHSIIGKLNYIIHEFGNRQTEDLPDLKPLRKIIFDLNDALPTLGEPGKNWMDGSFFDAGTEFTDLMSEISDFKLFGPDMVNVFAAMTAGSFKDFQNSLRQINKILVPQKPMDDPKKAHPSDGIFALQKHLTSIFNEPFMQEPSGEMFVYNIPESHVVFWNSKLIDMAVDEIKQYEDYMTKHFEDMPAAIRGTLKEAARANLQKIIVGYIAKAQTIVPRPNPGSSLAAAEETLRNKIDDVKTIVPKFIKLLEVMNQGGVGTAYVQLRTLLGTLSSRLLKQVDEILEGYSLYRVKDNNFAWWNGNSNPIYDGFGAKDNIDLNVYLDKQRSLMHHLAMDYAEFMVTFLANPIMREYNGQDQLVNKWKRIIDDVDGYDKKKPGNTLIALEDTISKDLINVDLKKCFTAIPLSEIRAGSGDFFKDRRDELRRNLLAQCEVLKRHQSIANYKKLADYFNQTMRDKFPFLASPRADSPEADPSDLKEFFHMYKEMGDDPKEIFDQVYQLGVEAEDNYAFLTAMERIKNFFEPFLKSEVPAEVPSFDVEIAFRANRSRELRANLIIDWGITLSDTNQVNNHMKSTISKWSYGNEILVGLRWPQASRMQPYNDPNQPNLKVDEGIATFTYQGKWSLLWMVRQSQALRSEFSALEEPVPYLLKFDVPNGPEDKTIAFIRVTFLSPGKGGKPGKPMRIPPFPTMAPEIPTSVMLKENQPVLVMGNQPSFTPVVAKEEPIPPTAPPPPEPPPAPPPPVAAPAPNPGG